MYEDDTPPAERRAQALSLDRDLLRELLGPGGAPRPDRPGCAGGRRAATCAAIRVSPDELHDVLRRRGDLRIGEYDTELAESLISERRAVFVRFASDERLIAAEDAGRYRDALGAMPPSGLPEVFLESEPDPLQSLVARYARSRGPFTTGEANDAFRPRRRAGAARPRAGGEARPRRAPAGRDGARVVRPRRPPPAAPRVARRAAQGGRAGRAGDARALPAELARRRPQGDASRGARAAPGAVAARLALGVGGAAAPGTRLPAGAPRPAVRDRRGRVGRRGPRPGRALLPRGRLGSRDGRRAPPLPRERLTTAFARRWPAAPSSGSTCSRAPASSPSPHCPRCGISSGRAR